jgi:hypothetical protein
MGEQSCRLKNMKNLKIKKGVKVKEKGKKKEGISCEVKAKG